VDDAGDVPERWVFELVAPQDRLEGAVSAVVRELCAAHVERDGSFRHLVDVGDIAELGFGVDESAGSAMRMRFDPRGRRGASPISRGVLLDALG
jgi:hypothetical protein